MKRDPLGHWLLTMFTLSQYGIVWLFLLARDANQLCGGRQLNLHKHVRWFSVAYGFYALGCLSISLFELQPTIDAGWIEALFFWMLPLAAGITIYFGWMLVQIARMLRRLSGTNKPASGMVIFLSLFWATSLPYLQAQLNRQLKARNSGSA